jgi:hypothetical protein
VLHAGSGGCCLFSSSCVLSVGPRSPPAPSMPPGADRSLRPPPCLPPCCAAVFFCFAYLALRYVKHVKR